MLSSKKAFFLFPSEIPEKIKMLAIVFPAEEQKEQASLTTEN